MLPLAFKSRVWGALGVPDLNSIDAAELRFFAFHFAKLRLLRRNSPACSARGVQAACYTEALPEEPAHEWNQAGAAS